MKCEEINKRIFDIAKAQGLKKIPLATIAGVSYNTIHRLSKVPSTQISLVDAAKICHVLNITLNDLVTNKIASESNSILIATKLEELVNLLKSRS